MPEFDPPELDEMPCPWGHCFASMKPRVHRTDPHDASLIEIVYPIHDAVGADIHWFGRCPASQLVVLPMLTERGRQVLADAEQEYLRRYRERVLADAERHDRVSDLVHDMIEHPEKYPTPKRGTPPPPSVEDYFPGRPADAPEPGVGDAPAAKIPLDKLAGHSQPLGKAGEMSTQETHSAMVYAARAAIGEAQDSLSATILALEVVENMVAVLPPKVTAAHALVHAAVGSASNLPEPAIAMRAEITAALDTVVGDRNIAHACAVLRARITALGIQLVSASKNAETYAQMPK